MRFFAVQQSLQTDFSRLHNGSNEVKTYTSPLMLEKWFFDCIRRFGEITFLTERSVKEAKIIEAFKCPKTIFLSLHGRKNSLPGLDDISKRTLRLAHSSFLIPDTLFSLRDFLPTQINLVSTHFEKKRIKAYLGKAAPKIEVFTPKVDTDFFCVPDTSQRLLARKKRGLLENQIHIVYAGRWIVDKGIPQLIRALDIWPLSGAVVTLVGNFEPEFLIHHALGNHSLFANFLEDEYVSRISRDWLCFQPTQDAVLLRELFWSADLFVNPSIHADENFGITPREAASCGVPVLTTNFCGLRPLADKMPWGGIDTYPTRHGSRFSLLQFRRLIDRALLEAKLYPPEGYRKAILKECNLHNSRNDLARALEQLRKLPLKSNEEAKKFKQSVKRILFKEASEKIVKSLIFPEKNIPSGCYMYGSGPTHPAFKSLQGVFSAIEDTPVVQKGSSWRGFFRIGFYKEEKAIIEFGFPGPRMHHYKEKSWNILIACIHQDSQNEWVLIPQTKEQIRMVQELVEYGYLIPDD